MLSRPINHELSFLNPKTKPQKTCDSKYVQNKPVWIRLNKSSHKWSPGILKDLLGSKMNLVVCNDGRAVRIHQDQIHVHYLRNEARERHQPIRLEYK